MNNKMIFIALFFSIVSSLNALSFSEKYDTYRDKLAKERDRVTDSRDLKAEARRWNDDIDKLTDRREFKDKIRETESSIRHELSRIF